MQGIKYGHISNIEFHTGVYGVGFSYKQTDTEKNHKDTTNTKKCIKNNPNSQQPFKDAFNERKASLAIINGKIDAEGINILLDSMQETFMSRINSIRALLR